MCGIVSGHGGCKVYCAMLVKNAVYSGCDVICKYVVVVMASGESNIRSILDV